MKDSIIKYDDYRGFGELFWNLCISCGGVSVRTTHWEDGTRDEGECLICMRMSETMELEELFNKENQSI